MIVIIIFSTLLRKAICHKGAKARSRKILRIFICVFESLYSVSCGWLNSIFVKNCLSISLKYFSLSDYRIRCSKRPRLKQAYPNNSFKIQTMLSSSLPAWPLSYPVFLFQFYSIVIAKILFPA